MSTPEENPEIPGVEDALARARAAHKEMAAALDEDQEPELDEDLGGSRSGTGPGSASRKRRRSWSCTSSGACSRAPGSAASQPRSHAGPAPRRAGSATRLRAAMPAPRPGCGTPTPGFGDDDQHRPPSGADDVQHPVAMHDIEWAPLGLHPMDATMSATAPEWRPLLSGAPRDDGRQFSRAPRCPASDAPDFTRCAPPGSYASAARPLVRLRAGGQRPLVQVRAGARFPLTTLDSGALPLARADLGRRSEVKGVSDTGPAAARRAPGAVARPSDARRGGMVRATWWSGAPSRPVRGALRGPGRSRRPPSGAEHRRQSHRSHPG